MDDELGREAEASFWHPALAASHARKINAAESGLERDRYIRSGFRTFDAKTRHTPPSFLPTASEKDPSAACMYKQLPSSHKQSAGGPPSTHVH